MIEILNSIAFYNILMFLLIALIFILSYYSYKKEDFTYMFISIFLLVLYSILQYNYLSYIAWGISELTLTNSTNTLPQMMIISNYSNMLVLYSVLFQVVVVFLVFMLVMLLIKKYFFTIENK